MVFLLLVAVSPEKRNRKSSVLAPFVAMQELLVASLLREKERTV